MNAATTSIQFDAARAQRFASAFNAIKENVQYVVRGKPLLVDNAILCMISGGHLLIEDVPGLGKTLLAKAMSASVGAKMGRIQFTPDLLPSDVTGVSIWNRTTSTFEFKKGPVFSEVLLADEINRAAPKTQSALLEAMAESQVTVDGNTHQLPDPFMVVATQNPIEQEGTYPLPESQLDRFQMKVSVGYPTREDELAILHTHESENVIKKLQPVASVQDILKMSQMISAVQIAPALRSYIVLLAEATRNHPAIQLGMSPRGTLSLQKVARAKAASRGRTFVTDDDIKSSAVAVMGHRILLRPEAGLQSTSTESVIVSILQSVPIPQARS